MKVRGALTAPVVLVGCLAFASAAGAETVLTGFGGIVFGGDLASSRPGDLDTSNRHGVYGAGVAFLGSPLGLEIDFAYSPDFFGGDRASVPKNNLTTLMANLVLSARVGARSRIYASTGGGLLKSRVDNADDFFDVDRNDFGADLGAGVLIAVGDNLGLRGDLRYFRNLGDEEPDGGLDIDFGSFDYWRATAGVALRF